jgi:hypothetical protein
MVDEDRLAGADDLRAKTGGRSRFHRDVLPVQSKVRVVHQVRFGIENANANDRVENTSQLVAYCLVHALNAALTGQRLLHSVDDRNFCAELLDPLAIRCGPWCAPAA